MKHDITFYMDGHVKVEYCRVCGVEGEKLFEDCSGEYRSWPSNANQLKVTQEIIEKYHVKLDKSDKKD